jgi:hypothetical protein
MILADFLERELSASGPWNCSTFPADWCIARGHPDFARNWRWITDARRCERIARRGLLRLWWRGIGDALPFADNLRAGDIGVVRRAGMEAGAIYTGERWALRADRGLTFLRLPETAVVKAWRP